MNSQELEDIVLRHSAQLADTQRVLAELNSKEKRVESTLKRLKERVEQWVSAFDQDKYKGIDQRLQTMALASEILIFDKLGYEFGSPGSQFVLGVAALLEGRHQAALEYLKSFDAPGSQQPRAARDANYLAAMICYNTKRFSEAIDFFEKAFQHSPIGNRDWQSKIYVAELQFFLRRPGEVVHKAFFDAQEGLARCESSNKRKVLEATLWLKLGNCFVGNLDLTPKEENLVADSNSEAINCYKKARQICPRKNAEADSSLLPAIIDYSLAQALLLEGKIDIELAETPSSLFVDVFNRLRRIVLKKREEIILAQTYFMLATCAYYSNSLSKDVAEIYLEHARHQTLSVPSGMCFYSCITKELLEKDSFVEQIDYYASRFQLQKERILA
jgi:tetratricopeptide (TPR) repeat protein